MMRLRSSDNQVVLPAPQLRRVWNEYNNGYSRHTIRQRLEHEWSQRHTRAGGTEVMSSSEQFARD